MTLCPRNIFTSLSTLYLLLSRASIVLLLFNLGFDGLLLIVDGLLFVQNGLPWASKYEFLGCIVDGTIDHDYLYLLV